MKLKNLLVVLGASILATTLALTVSSALLPAVPSSKPMPPDKSYIVDMNDAKAAGTVTAVVHTDAVLGGNRKTTTVKIDVDAGETGTSKLQKLEAKLNAASPDDGSSGNAVAATFVANPGYLAVAAASGQGIGTVTGVSVKDKGILQDINITPIKPVPDQLASEGLVVIFGDPSGLNPSGQASTMIFESGRGPVSCSVDKTNNLESVTSGAMSALEQAGYSVRSPANGVFQFILNEPDDGGWLMFGTDDTGLEYSIGVK